MVRFSVPAPEALRKFLPVYLIWRVLSLFLCLFHALLISVPRGFCERKRVDGVLVQNPPAMPLLAVVYLYCKIIRAANGYQPAFIIDWHNLVRKGFRKTLDMLRVVSASWDDECLLILPNLFFAATANLLGQGFTSKFLRFKILNISVSKVLNLVKSTNTTQNTCFLPYVCSKILQCYPVKVRSL